MNRFEIRVAGHVGPRRAAALGCAVRPLESGESVLLFEAVDPTALYGLLSRLRDAGLELIEVRPIGPARSEERQDEGGSR